MSEQVTQEAWPLEWCEYLDDDGSTVWEAASPYHDDGVPFRFRLRQRTGDKFVMLDSDSELVLAGERGMFWDDPESGKEYCQRQADQIVSEERSHAQGGRGVKRYP